MNANRIQRVGVLGAGTMGLGIARVCAGAGLTTLLFDVSPELIDKGINAIQKNLAKEVEKEKVTPDQEKEILRRILPCTSLYDLDADLVIEAVVESLEIKQKLFYEIEKIGLESGKSIVLATNTSSLSVTAIASVLRYPGRCVGLHFFNPAQSMKLVEVVAGTETRVEIVQGIVDFAKLLGKITAKAKDSPGFIVNRVARHYYVESLKVLQDGVCDVAGIDQLLRSAGFRMGPFELMDLIGIDTNFSVTSSLYLGFDKAERFKPSPIQQQKVESGQLGRKSGKGFYDYEKN